MFLRLYRVSVVFEILLFPWINSGLAISNWFYIFFTINILSGFWLRFLGNQKLSHIDLIFILLVLVHLFNPETYWQKFGIDATYFRVTVFLIRYLSFYKFNLSSVHNFFALGIIISSGFSIYLWTKGYGDSWRLNYPYGDANYQGFIFGTYVLILFHFMSLKNPLVFLAIVMSLLIVFAGASRGAIISLFIVGVFSFINYHKGYRLLFIIPLISLFLYTIKDAEVINDLVFVERLFSPRETDKGAADSRFTEISLAFKEFNNHPENILFGFGLSKSANSEVGFFNSKYRIHNTPVAILFDSGIIGLIIVLFLFLKLGFNVYYRNSLGYLLLFISLNSLTFYILSFYHFFICLRLMRENQ